MSQCRATMMDFVYTTEELQTKGLLILYISLIQRFFGNWIAERYLCYLPPLLFGFDSRRRHVTMKWSPIYIWWFPPPLKITQRHHPRVRKCV